MCRDAVNYGIGALQDLYICVLCQDVPFIMNQISSDSAHTSAYQGCSNHLLRPPLLNTETASIFSSTALKIPAVPISWMDRQSAGSISSKYPPVPSGS